MQHTPQNWDRDGYTVTTDPIRFDINAIHAFLANDSYWAKNIPIETLR